MTKIGLRQLKSQKGFEVYYVRDCDKVKVQGQTGPIQIYKEGFNGYVEECDFDEYNRFFAKKGYPPSAAKVGEVVPNHDSIKPGIEVMLSRRLFQGGAKEFYHILDALGLDSGMPSQSYDAEFRRLMLRNRRNAKARIDSFLNCLYQPLKEGNRRGYERQLIQTLKGAGNPEKFFDLHILGGKEARWTDFDYLDLNQAFKKRVRINIDWGIASKMLALLTDPITK